MPCDKLKVIEESLSELNETEATYPRKGINGDVYRLSNL